MQIIQPSTPEQLEAFRGLLREWFDFLVNDCGIDMRYQSIEAELAELPGSFGPPGGRIWLAYGDAGKAVGCVALRPIQDDGVCELKRLYVRPAHRGAGAGRALTVQAIDEARAMGYRLMRLDTGTFLDASRRLYASLGFVETGPYYDVPPDVLRVTVFMELPLTIHRRESDSELGRVRGFRPIVGLEPRLLILGTIPSELSLQAGRYYAHPRNDFWPVMERLFAGGRPLEYVGRVAMLEQAGVALWDVLRQADRVGSLDANIKKPVPNDVAGLLRDHPSIRAVFFNGAVAERLFSTYVAPSLTNSALRFVRLPSTSPANATISFALKLAAWDAVRVAVTG